MVIRLILLILFLPSLVFSAPSIGTITDTFSDGGSVTIPGTGFGTNALNFSWLGGKNGEIENTSTGSNPSVSNWTFFEWNPDANVQSDQYHSGTKSIKIPLKDDGSDAYYAGIIRYNYSAGVTFGGKMFLSWWVRFNHKKTGGESNQWKMFRACWENSILDAAGVQVKTFNRDPADEFFVQNTDETTVTDSMWPSYPENNDTWYRIDLIISPETSDGADDGYFTWALHTPGSAITSTTEYSITLFNGSNDFYKWMLWQNYVGNGITGSTVWMDDFMVQEDTVARVEIGDASTWSACTHREIQEPTAWESDGSEITINVNTGSFDDGSAYLYVVDSAGDVNSNGYEITIDNSAPTKKYLSIGKAIDLGGAKLALE